MSDGEESSINWKELSVDKSIDVILVPLGLFAALWLQGWVDDRKEKEDYKGLLKDFQAEIATNRAKASAIEDDLGPITEVDPEKVLGPLSVRFTEFGQETADAVKLIDCLDLMIDHAAATAGHPAPGPGEEAPPQPEEEGDDEAAPSGAEAPPAAPPAEPAAAPAPPAAPAPEPAKPSATPDDRLAECSAFLEEVGKREDKKFKPIDLAPLYRYEVWQVYLASGIKLFKDPEAKALGLKLGEVYSAAKEVEKRVEDIERVFNDSFMKSQGDLASLGAELEDLLGDFDDVDALRAAKPRLAEMSNEVLGAKYAAINVEQVVILKTERLKEYVGDMNKKFDALKAEIDKESAR